MTDESQTPSLVERLKIKLPTNLDPQDPILIIQQQQDLRLIMVHHLKKMNFLNISTAANGYDGLEVMRAAELEFKMIIVDMTMDVMGGIDFVNEVKETTELRRPPICMTIADPNKERIMHAIESGVDEILVKPFTLGDLNPKIRKAFKIFHNPRNPEPVYELAKNLLRQKEFEKAKQIYRLLAEAAPQAARPPVGLAKIAFEENQTDQALALLDQAQKQNPHFVYTHELRGRIFASQNRWDDAIKSLQTAISISPLNPMRYKIAAELLFKVQRYRDAVVLLSSGVEKGIDFNEIYHFLSQAHFALDEHKLALKYIRSALGKEPENITYLNQLGVCHRHLKDYEEGMKVYNQIIKIDPGNKIALYNKGVLLHSMGQIDEAVKLFKKVLLKYPDFKEAQTKLSAYEQELKDKEKNGAKAAS